MNFNNKPQDIEALPSEYQEFYHNLRTKLADERIITDPVRTFAYGVDASLYRITPKMVVRSIMRSKQPLFYRKLRLNI